MRRRYFWIILLFTGTLLLTGCNNSDNTFNDTCTESSGIAFDNVKVIQSSNLLESIELNSTHHLMTFSASVQNIKEKDILVMDTSVEYPAGLSIKVDTVEQTNGMIKVVASKEVGLGDMFKEVQLCHHLTLKEENIVNSNISEGQAEIYSGELEKKHPLYDFSYDIDKSFAHDYITLTGQIHFKIDYDLNIKAKTTCTWFKGCHMYLHNGTKFTIDPEVYADLILTAEKEYEQKEEKILYSVSFEPITIPVAGIPIVIVPELYIVAGIDVDVDGSIQTGIWADTKGVLGIRYYGQDEGWKPVENISHTFGEHSPTIDASAKAKAYVGPQVKLKLYDITGPYADILAYGQLDANIHDDPWWKLHGGIESYGGFKMRVLHHTLVNVHKKLYSKDFIIVEAHGEFP